MPNGQDIVALALQHKGERYVLGAPVPLANRNWKGPWDCAEFASWACYHAYGLVFAVRPNDIRRGESYSGWWYDDVVKMDLDIPVGKAIATPGAMLIRRPGAFGIKIGHIAISRGDGTTIEAHSKRVGVAVRSATDRQWSIGALLPGVQYAAQEQVPDYREPERLIKLTRPYMSGREVSSIQNALAAAGIDPGNIDGVFGPLTHTAVAAFQAREGLLMDGVVGPETAGELGLNWPV